jgi:hypothetical protein
MGWYRKQVARKFDGSKSRRYPGRPRIDDEVDQHADYALIRAAYARMTKQLQSL